MLLKLNRAILHTLILVSTSSQFEFAASGNDTPYKGIKISVILICELGLVKILNFVLKL